MRESMQQYPRPTLPRNRKPEPPAGTPEHAEWLLDEAEDETFPASDATAPSQPGSSASVNSMAEEGRNTMLTEEELRTRDGKKE
jgi:hypothetical protein